MRPTVVLRDAEGGHSIASHAGEAVPLPIDLVIARGLAVGAIYLMIGVPPGLVQADVGGAGVQGCQVEELQGQRKCFFCGLQERGQEQLL